MVGPDSYGISRAPHYLGVHQRRCFHFSYWAFTLCVSLSQHDSAIKTLCNSSGVLQHSAHGSRNTEYTTPAGLACIRFRLYPFRSPLLGASLTISLPPVTEMFHFTGLPPFKGAWITPCRFPHSDIRGSKEACSSPRLIAAGYVFHRHLAPRHSPRALCTLTS